MPLFHLTNDLAFPPVHLSFPDGLLAVGGDLSLERLLLAYRSGIFPWYSRGDPILWWSPDPRTVLFLDEFHVSRSLKRVMKRGAFDVRFDTAFDRVIRGCAQARGKGRFSTWITPEMKRAYCALHDAGYAHSVETWMGDELAGGLYGVSLGACFFGESMFTRRTNASKVALAVLVEQLIRWKFHFIDCQLRTRHLESLGAREIRRRTYLDLLDKALRAETRRGPWVCEVAIKA